MKSRNTTVAAVLATAAVAGVAAGVLIHGMTGAGATPSAGTGPSTAVSGSSGTTAPPRTSGTSTAVTTRTAPPTSAAAPVTTRATTTAPSPTRTPSSASSASSPRAAFSEKSLMVANDYVAAGWPTAQLHTAPGAGQATITACQTKSPEAQYGLRKMYSAQADSGDLYADQYVLDFRETADAQQMVSEVLDWRTQCTDPSNEGMKGVGFRASSPVQVTLPDGSEGQRWTMDFDQDNHLLRQLVSVVRTGTRVSVSVVSTSPEAAKVVDAETLAERSAARLG